MWTAGCRVEPQPFRLFGSIDYCNMLTFNYGKYIKAKFSLIIIGCVLLYGCREKLLPEIKDNNINYLVVEGLINTGADSTIYTLTRKFKLNNKAIEASIVARQPMSMPLNIAPGGYTATGDLDCVDCRRQWGTTIKPPYWY